jgi:hypothetical protein
MINGIQAPQECATWAKDLSRASHRFQDPIASFTTSIAVKFCLFMKTSSWLHLQPKKIIYVDQVAIGMDALEILCTKGREVSLLSTFPSRSRGGSIINRIGACLVKSAIVAPLGACYNGSIAAVCALNWLDNKYEIMPIRIMESPDKEKMQNTWKKVEQYAEGFWRDFSYVLSLGFVIAAVLFVYNVVYNASSMDQVTNRICEIAMRLLIIWPFLVETVPHVAHVAYDELSVCHLQAIPKPCQLPVLTALIARNYCGLLGKEGLLLKTKHLLTAKEHVAKMKEEFFMPVLNSKLEKLKYLFNDLFVVKGFREKLIASQKNIPLFHLDKWGLCVSKGIEECKDLLTKVKKKGLTKEERKDLAKVEEVVLCEFHTVWKSADDMVIWAETVEKDFPDGIWAETVEKDFPDGMEAEKNAMREIGMLCGDLYTLCCYLSSVKEVQ